jgi:hypothetical protein
MSSWILLWMLLLAGVVIYWRSARLSAEAALRAARSACEQTGVQLLDQTVAFRRFVFKRGELQRLYSFDYCPNGSERFRGVIHMRGVRAQTVAFDPSLNPVLISDLPPQ